MPTQRKLLVTGAGGHLGRRVVELLLDAKVAHIVAASRHPEKLGDLAARGAEIRKADFDDPRALASAFAGVDRALLISTDALDAPGHRIAQHRAAIAVAKQAGVKHVTYTSAAAARPGIAVLDDHYWTEQALAESGLAWTILRNHLYADLLLMSLPQAVATGQLFTATAGRGRSYVTREDCARAAAGALAATSSDRRILDVTGPAPVTQDEVAALTTELTGKPIRHIALRPEQLREGLLGAGLAPAMADALVAFDSDAAQGYHAIVTPVVRELTGRDPTSVRAFLTANKTALLPAHAA